MTRILIVDDEEIERMALQKIIETEITEVEVIGQAENGRQAIEMAEQHQPDLILMDIKMPGIDGLGAIEAIQKKFDQITFIIVSSYDTFDYARQALRLGVKDYLVKPSPKDDIVSTIHKVIHEIEQKKREEKDWNKVQEQIQFLMPILETDLVTQLLFDHVHEVHLQESMDILGIQTTDLFYTMVLFYSPKKGIVEGPNLDEFYLTLKRKFSQHGKGWIGAMSGSQIPIICFWDKTQGSYRLQASLLARALLQLAQHYPAIQLFVGIGGVYNSFDELKHSYHEALLASVELELPAKFCFYEDLVNKSEQSSQMLLRIEKQILEEIRTGNWEEVTQQVLFLIQYFQKEQKSVLEAQQRIHELFLVMFRILEEMGFHLEKPYFSTQISHYQQLRTEATCKIENISKSILALKHYSETDVAQKIKQYIVQNSATDISLEMIAEKVNLSPYYISKLFKDEFDISYIDFLTQCRIQKAKDLIWQGKLSLKEVAYEVGYRDPNYFSRVFKKTCGVSPTQYKNKLLNRNES